MSQSYEGTLLRDAERYEAYRVFEEKTDIGERLSLPIENHLTLEVFDGAVYGRDIEGRPRRMTEWAEEAYRNSVQDPAYEGANSVERIRRKLELEEAEAVEAMRPGEGMVVFSPIPDAALEGKLTIHGYRTDLARTFCRLYRHNGESIHSVTLSLEQSNKQALVAAAGSCGVALPASLQSETILAHRSVQHFSETDFNFLPDLIRSHYDLSLYEQTGESFFAGNRLAGRQDSMRFIDDNHDLIEEHMTFLRSIEERTSPGQLRNTQLEELRKRTAAALDERLHGGSVTSISDASVAGRMEVSNYGGECATGTQPSAQEQMGLAQGKHVTNCPLCGTRGVTATVEGETITCSDCRGSVDICTGKVTRGKALSRQTPVSRKRSPTQMNSGSARRQSSETQLSQKYGEKVLLKRHKTIGGEDMLVLNRRGEVIDVIR